MTRRDHRGCRALGFAIVLLFARASSGQGLSPLQELGTQVSAEDRIIVTATDGRPVNGRLLSVSDATLRLATQGAVREFRAADVERVDRIVPDGLKNGALWGLAAGLGAALLTPPLFNDFIKIDDDDTAIVLGLFVLPGAGAAAGALIDKSMTGSVPIYVRRRIAMHVAFGAAARASGASVGVEVSF
jgi:hypothetical protein